MKNKDYLGVNIVPSCYFFKKFKGTGELSLCFVGLIRPRQRVGEPGMQNMVIFKSRTPLPVKIALTISVDPCQNINSTQLYAVSVV